jgi:hypothetical protein
MGSENQHKGISHPDPKRSLRESIYNNKSPKRPRRCSGLDIVQHDTDGLLEVLNPDWQLEQQVHETHRTPSGSVRSFNYFLIRGT